MQKQLTIQLARQILPLALIIITAIFITIATFSGLGYVNELENKEKLDYRNKLSDTVEEYIQDIERIIDDSQRALDTMCDLVVLSNGQLADFEGTAKYLLDEYSNVSGLMLAPNGVVKQVYPFKPNEAAVGHDLLTDPARKVEVRESIRLKKSIIAGPVNMLQGGLGLFVRKPIFTSEKGEKIFWGLGIALINWETISKLFLLNTINSDSISYVLTRKLSTDVAPMVISRSINDISEGNCIYKDISIPGGIWRLTMSEEYKLPSGYSIARAIVLLIDTMFIFAVVFLYKSRLKISTQEKLLSIANHNLQRDIAERQKIEDSLRQSEIRFRSLTSMLPVGVYLCGNDGACLYVNEKWLEMAGLTIEQAMGHGWRRSIHSDDRDRVLANWDRMVEFNGTWGEEYRFHTPNGKTTFVYGVASIIRDDTGKITGYVGANLDITERKQAELELLENYDRYHTLFSQAPVGIIRFDMNGVNIEVNAKFSEIFGTPVDHLIGIDIFQKEKDDMMLMAIKDALDGKLGEYEGDYTSVASGRKISLRALFKSTQAQNGQLTGCFGIFEDISDRKQAERNVWQKEHDLRSILDNIPSLIGSWDKNLINRFCNKAYSEWFGIDPEKMPGMYVEDVIGEDIFRINLPYMEKALSGIPQVFERDIPVLGSEQIRQSLVQYLPDVQGEEVHGIYAIISDVTLFKQAQKDIERARDIAEAASFAKSEFLANMSHEIRTPLNGIMGMLQLVGFTPLDDEQSEYISNALRSATRLSALLSDLLDLSRIEAGKMLIMKTKFDIRDIVKPINELFSIVTKEKNIELVITIDEHIPPWIVGDETRLLQVLFNLVGNALKFTEKGFVCLEAVILPYSNDFNCHILFTISDTGIGMSDDLLTKIFTPFLQGDHTATKRFQGAGLGLSIVRKVVLMLEGNVAVDSVAGEGTVFYMSIPFGLPETQDMQVMQASNDQVKHVEICNKILLVEDDEINLKSTKLLLEKLGYRVQAALNGQECLQMLSEHDFDLIIIDIQMPIMNGMDATKEIRESGKFGAKSSIPIIAMTAYAMTGDKEKFLTAGMNDYIAKPVMLEPLVYVIKRVIDKSCKQS